MNQDLRTSSTISCSPSDGELCISIHSCKRKSQAMSTFTDSTSAARAFCYANYIPFVQHISHQDHRCS